jgi:hypothetical protein
MVVNSSTDGKMPRNRLDHSSEDSPEFIHTIQKVPFPRRVVSFDGTRDQPD